MREINQLKPANITQLLQKIKTNITPAKEAEPGLLTRSGGVDSVTFSTISTVTETTTKPTQKSESYQDLLNEFSQKYGEGRSLEQAKLGIEYMTKILACEDLPEEMRADFEAKKQGYEMMLVEFENYAKQGTGEKVADVWNEFEDFINQYKKDPEGASYNQGTEYWLAYHETCMSFYERLLQCDNLTDDLKAEYEQMIQEHRNDKEKILKEQDDRSGITARSNLLEQGLTDEVIDKYFDLVINNTDTGVATYIPKGMFITYTIDQNGNTTQLRFFDINGEQIRYVIIQDGEIKLDIDTKNTTNTENETESSYVDKAEKKVTGGTYGALLSMGFSPALIQRYFDAPDPNAPSNSLEKFTYTLKENIEILPGSGAYITSLDELVELLKKYGIIK